MSDQTERSGYAVEVSFIQLVSECLRVGHTTQRMADVAVVTSPIGYVFD